MVEWAFFLSLKIMKIIIQYTLVTLITTFIGLSVAFKTTKTITIDSGKITEWSFPTTTTNNHIGKCLTVKKLVSGAAKRQTIWQ